MKSALIGHTGFVGSNIFAEGRFSHTYHSTNITEIEGQEFDLVVSAGFSSVKWQANQHGNEDWESIESLLRRLDTVRTRRFVLVSTVDVYPQTTAVDEDTPLRGTKNGAYGLNRYKAEEWIAQKFPEHLIVRLPALFGNGLKKNVLFDLLHDNELEKVNPASTFQYYDLSRLWQDIERCLSANVSLANLVTAPVSTAEIVEAHFSGKKDRIGAHANPVQHYDIRTKHAGIFGNTDGYVYGKDESLRRLASFISSQSEA